ncbi:MAG: hypothetical protein AB8F95_08450 [Bacteroidia bacterium]
MYKPLKTMLWVLFLAFINVADSQQNQAISLYVITCFGNAEQITVWTYATNHTTDTVRVLKPIPYRYDHRSNQSTPNPPEFFDLRIITENVLCDYPVSPVGRTIKTAKDFITIPPQAKREVVFNTGMYQQGVCKASPNETVKLIIQYAFDKQCENKAQFESYIKKEGSIIANPAEANRLFAQLQKSFKATFSTDTIEVVLADLEPKHNVHQWRFRLRAEYEQGITFDSIYFKGYEKHRDLVTSSVVKAAHLNPEFCEGLVHKLSGIYPSVSGSVYHYLQHDDDYCVALCKALKNQFEFFAKSEIEQALKPFIDTLKIIQTDSIFSKHTILGMYYPLASLGPWSKENFLTQLWVLSLSKDGSHYLTTFSKNQFSLKPYYHKVTQKVTYDGKEIVAELEKKVYSLNIIRRKQKRYQFTTNGNLVMTDFRDLTNNRPLKIEQSLFLKID